MRLISTPLLRWQCTIVDFARMGETGIFTEEDRVELIDGEGLAIILQDTQPDGACDSREQTLERGHDIVSPTIQALQLTVNQVLG